MYVAPPSLPPFSLRFADQAPPPPLALSSLVCVRRLACVARAGRVGAAGGAIVVDVAQLGS